MSYKQGAMRRYVKKYYAERLSGDENVKGLHMYRNPYLWDENNPVEPVLDSPTENFIPTPVMDDGVDVVNRKRHKITTLIFTI